MNKEIPQEFNWVEARANCSIGSMFRLLEADAEKDVQIRNNDTGARRLSFTFRVGSGGDEFLVLEGDNGPLIMFRLMPEHISVQDRQREEMFKATVTLNNEGRCVRKVNGEELERWQVLRLALEGLFFP